MQSGRLRFIAAILPFLLTAGCGLHGTRDTAPAINIDVSRIQDAVPVPVERSRYGNPESYVVHNKRYHVLDSSQGFAQKGIASWYGTKFHGRRTSSGEPYNMLAMTAAHKTLPLPTYVEVTNLDNKRKIIVKVNDRGPFKSGRIIDLSYVAAKKLGIAEKGTGRVSIRTIEATLPVDKPQVVPFNTRPLIPTRFEPMEATPAATPTIEQIDSEEGTTPQADVTTTQQSAPDNNKVFLQVGAFHERPNAERLREKLLPVSPAGVRVSQSVKKDRPLFRVSIGPLASARDAVTLAEKLSTLGLYQSSTPKTKD